MRSAAVTRNDAARQALVVGLGLTGLSCVRYLSARGYAVTVADTRAQPPQLAELKRDFPQVAFHHGFDPALFARFPTLVVSPGVSLAEPAIRRAQDAGAAAIGDIELFAHAARAPVIAVTGSNGKSTVATLADAMCRAGGLNARLGGNIGVPALSLLSAAEPDVYVLELSSFQLETTTSLNARAAAVLNITPDHMDRYPDVAAYAAAKTHVYDGAGLMVLNLDDPLVMAMERPERRRVGFGLRPPAAADDYGVVPHAGAEWLAQGSERILPARDVALVGKHNLANALAALALTQAIGVARAAQTRALREFRGLPHRTELVAERDGIRWINDSKGTNVGATVAALNGMTAPVVLIAGGDGKGADFTDLKPACAAHARAVVLIGRDAARIEAALAGAVPTVHAGDMADAVRRARSLAQAGDVVMLSPACASFDMFRNYEHRGEVFRAAVKEALR